MAFDLNDAWSWIERLVRRVDRLESGSMLENSSITNGRMRFIAGLLRLDSGARLEVEGSVAVSGPTYLDGPVEITETLDVLATTKLRGALELLADLVVKAGGKITIEGARDMVLGQTPYGPGIAFTGGGKVVSEAGGVVLYNAAEDGHLSLTALASSFLHANIGFIISAAGISAIGQLNTARIQSSGEVQGATLRSMGRIDVAGNASVQGNGSVVGRLYNPGMESVTGSANVFLNASNYLQKVTSASRFKIDPQPMDLPGGLLDVRVKSWIDLGNAERYAALIDAPRPLAEEDDAEFSMPDPHLFARIPGVIAEEVEAAGGHEFVTYTAEGDIEGVAYDRLALARTEILADRLEAALARIDELESRLAAA